MAETLEIEPGTVCFIIVKAREFFAKEGATEDSEASSAVDEGFRSVLEDLPDDPVVDEIRATIDALNEDKIAELIALAWLGRGTYGKDEWAEGLAEAKRQMTARTVEYLLGMPLLADYLEEGLAQFDLSCADTEREHL